MHRRVTSQDVEDYSSHMPGDVVALDREEDIVYKKGVLTHSEGVSTIKMMPEVNNQPYYGYIFQSVTTLMQVSNIDHVERDSMEAELGSRRKRNDVMSDFSELFLEDMEEQNGSNSEDEEEDGFTMAEEPTYDESVDIDYFEASGTYSLDLIRQRRVLLRERREAVNHLELPEVMESTLMAHIDLSELMNDHNFLFYKCQL